jgi:hypothetical protein
VPSSTTDPISAELVDQALNENAQQDDTRPAVPNGEVDMNQLRNDAISAMLEANQEAFEYAIDHRDMAETMMMNYIRANRTITARGFLRVFPAAMDPSLAATLASNTGLIARNKALMAQYQARMSELDVASDLLETTIPKAISIAQRWFGILMRLTRP